MIKVACPNCSVRLTASDEHIGQAVNCQKCDAKFILSKRWMNEPLQILDESNHPTTELESSPSSIPSLPMAAIASISRSHRDHRRAGSEMDGFVQAHSAIEFFDFRFRRYLTPWILQISWIVVMVAALGWLLILSYVFISSLMQNSDFSIGRPESGVGFPSLSPFFIKSGIYFSSIAGVGLAVLWVRVLFESILMLFSIGKTLRAIKSDQ